VNVRREIANPRMVRKQQSENVMLNAKRLREKIQKCKQTSLYVLSERSRVFEMRLF